MDTVVILAIYIFAVILILLIVYIVRPSSPRLVRLFKHSKYSDYGFEHFYDESIGHYVAHVHSFSVASDVRIKTGDRIIEVNGTNVLSIKNQADVLKLIGKNPREVELLVVDETTFRYYTDKNILITREMEGIQLISNWKLYKNLNSINSFYNDASNNDSSSESTSDSSDDSDSGDDNNENAKSTQKERINGVDAKIQANMASRLDQIQTAMSSINTRLQKVEENNGFTQKPETNRDIPKNFEFEFFLENLLALHRSTCGRNCKGNIHEATEKFARNNVDANNLGDIIDATDGGQGVMNVSNDWDLVG